MSGDLYKNKTRLRVNGLLFKEHAILLAQIKSPVTNELVWMPPGGGIHFGESMEDCLKREFLEETGLKITVGSLIAINELVKPPFHTVEMYFVVKKKAGKLRLGHDPEHAEDQQVLKNIQWISLDKLSDTSLAPKELPQWIHSLQSDGNRPKVFFQSN